MSLIGAKLSTSSLIGANCLICHLKWTSSAEISFQVIMNFSTTTAALLILSVVSGESEATNTEPATEILTTRSSSNMFFLEANYAWKSCVEFVKSFFVSPPPYYFKYKLSLPEAETEGVVKVAEAAYNLSSPEAFYKALHSADSEQKALEIIFHPSSIHRLADLKTGRLLANEAVDRLPHIIYALMLRAKTLGKLYSPAYVNKAYSDCMTHIWGLITENSGTWPCKAVNSCDHQASIQLLKGAFSYEACKEIMKPQLDGLTHTLDEAIKKDPLLKNSAANVRRSLIHILLDSHYTNNLLYSGFANVQEMSAYSAIKKIEEVLNELKEIAESKEAYKEASKKFEEKCKEIDSKRSVKEEKLEQKIAENSSEIKAESSDKATPTIVQQATPTEPEKNPQVKHKQVIDTSAKPTNALYKKDVKKNKSQK